jgi:hypothetical protein
MAALMVMTINEGGLFCSLYMGQCFGKYCHTEKG